MRLTALLLTLLISIAPWGGAIAMWASQSDPSDRQIVVTEHAGMPCHGAAEAVTANDETHCPNCGNHGCDMDNCQCANIVAGVIQNLLLHSTPTHREQHPPFQQAQSSVELVPDSPPPIA